MEQGYKALVMMMYSEIFYMRNNLQFKNELRESLDICWKWLESFSVSGDDIYYLLDDRTDFGGIYILMQLDENEENIIYWDNISYALSYVAFLAYREERVNYVPAPIENVDEAIYDLFLKNLKDIGMYNEVEMAGIQNFVKSSVVTKDSALNFLLEKNSI